MSSKPDHLSSSVEREQQHHSIPRSSIQPLPVPAASAGLSSTNSRFGAPLPALHHDHHPRYNPTTSSAYDTANQTSAASTISYGSPFNNGFQPTSYPTSASSNTFTYSLASDPRPRIPSLQNPTSAMAPHNRTASGGTKSVSPGTGSSIRSEYTTSTPGLGRHLPSRAPQSDIMNAPHSPMKGASAVSPTMGITSPSHDHGSNGLGSANSAGPPLGETIHLHHLSSADGHMVRPEIHARVDKGFFLSDRDWTCYRRNYFSVICSYSLNPATPSPPLYLRRNQTSPPEHIIAFAMCISAVVDQPGGKTVELVQHTPKRDKGPQHRPAKIKLSPQTHGGMAYGGGASSSIVQAQPPGSHGQPGTVEPEYLFQHPSQQQHNLQQIAVFDRIQFKSATANNGKRRAAQQYYHLIVELYADVGSTTSTTPGQPNPQSDGWVKIAYRISAPMVVRGRSPGHYADERRASQTSSPGGGTAGGQLPGAPHPTSHTSGPGGYMDQSSMGSAPSGGPAQGMMQRVTSPPTQHPPAASPASSFDPPIDPELDVHTPISSSYQEYQYIHAPLYESAHLPPPPSVDSGYETYHNGDRKPEHPLETSCPQYEGENMAYVPKTQVKEEYGPAQGGQGQQPPAWLGSGAMVGREQRYNQHALFNSCGRFEGSETSKGLYPDITPL